MKKSAFTRITVWAYIFVMLALVVPIDTTASAAAAYENAGGVVKSGGNEYDSYIKQFADKVYASNSVMSFGNEATAIDNASFSVENDGTSVYWDGNNGSLSWKLDIPDDALYTLRMSYAFPDNSVDLKLSVRIDSEVPYEEAEQLYFPKKWTDTSETVRTDNNGNELAPEQVLSKEYITNDAADDTGINVEPFLFYLTKGVHILTVNAPKQPIRISKIGFGAPEKVSTYSDYSKNFKLTEESENNIITIQGENAASKSSNSLVAKSDKSNYLMTPSNPRVKKLNYIGGSSWDSPCQTIEWEFDALKSGYYYLALRYKQSEVINGESYRWLKIDGKTPFEEAKNLKFYYTPKWKFYKFAGDEEPYYIYLEKGSHTLSLTYTMSSMSEYYKEFSDIVEQLGDKYIEMVMVTGESPDVNRDYELFKQIPDLNEKLGECRNRLLNLADIQTSQSKRGNQYSAAMKNMARVLKSMIDSPYDAQYYVKDYYTNYTSLSSWLYEMKSMPLSIDEIQLVPYGKEYAEKSSNLFKSGWFGFQRLLCSFTKDYNKKSSNDYPEIRLWVNWGRDQTSILSSLINETFTPEHHINVKLEIVNASLINGIMSGNYPDISLHLSRTDPVNLGMRGALADLKSFSDYKDVLSRFQPGAEEPYYYNDKLYALPDTQSFFIMFYRTDVFEKLNLKVPADWDEFHHAITVIQRNNMQVYIPYTQITTTTTVNGGIGSLSLFPTLLQQSGLSLYNEDKNATALNNSQAISVFEDWIGFYKNDKLLKEANFYNRFRVGTMPLGIMNYSTYTTLYSAAPEIADRWSIACVPGNSTTENSSIAGSGTGCAIVNKSSHKSEAWEFLKWWTSAETQKRYSENVESVIGVISRIATSNVEAFSNLSWDADDKEILLEQWSRVKEIPEIPGSYYVSRAVDQAFWSVLNDGENEKYAVIKWSEIADSEIARKIKEYQ